MFVPLMMLLSPIAQTSDPLAPAREGKIECVTPDKAAKTCAAIVRYTAQPDGSWHAETEVMIAPSPLTTMTTRSVVRVEGQTICGTVRKAEFEAAVIKSGGAPVGADAAKPIMDQFLPMIAPLDGKQACSAIKPEGDLLLAQATLDGQAMPMLDQRYIWVGANEGYRIGTPGQ